jgi:hypothetical protein
MDRLLIYSSDKIETHRLASEYFIRTKNPKNALRSIGLGLSISKNDKSLFKSIQKLFSIKWDVDLEEDKIKIFGKDFNLDDYKV